MFYFTQRNGMHWPALGALAFGLMLALALFSGPGVVKAAGLSQDSKQSDDVCLGCHQQPGVVKALPSGESLDVTINPTLYRNSVHSKNNVACVVCHTNILGYPHSNFPADKVKTRRDFTFLFQETCRTCHQDKYQADSVHAQALSSGNRNAPTCADCHNPHTQTPFKDAQGNLLPAETGRIPQICARCHSTIYNEYAQSVHGKAAIEQNNPDVPLCITCHGMHLIENPTTAKFRLASPQLCGGCHTDKQKMAKYGLSTDVYNTYVADFHGTTVTLFEKTSPDQATNKAVCYDCHGVHDNKGVNDPNYGLSVKENMLKACQKCHPDATLNFPDSWLSHYTPSPAKWSLVYYVNLFYTIFIPTVLGGMALFVASDVFRRVKDRFGGKKSSAGDAGTSKEN